MPKQPRARRWRLDPIELIMGVLAVGSLVMLVLELLGWLSPDMIVRVSEIDVVIGIIFLVDFTLRWLYAADRGDWFKHNWWLLLACIPVSGDVAVALRIVRLERVVRVARVAGHVAYAGKGSH